MVGPADVTHAGPRAATPVNRSRRDLVRSLAHPPVHNPTFWWTQVIVVGVVVLRLVADALQDHGVLGVPGFVWILGLIFPVVFAGTAFGLVGSLGTALFGVVLELPTVLWLSHSRIALWGSWTNLATVVALAIVLGDRYDAILAGAASDARARARRLEEERFARAFEDNMAAMALIGPQGQILRANRAFADLHDVAPEVLVGQPLERRVTPEDRDALREACTLLVSGARDGVQTTWHIERAAHKAITVEATITALRLESTCELVASVRDVTDERRATARLAHAAHHDALTGLANRAVLLERIAHAQATSTAGLALFIVDLDNFKEVNDTLGHQLGDQLLVAVARRLESVVRHRDTLCRLGGDEFVYLVESARDSASAHRVAERLVAAFREPFTLGEHAISQRASIGAVHCDDGPDMECDDVLRDADIALYHTKATGKGGCTFFTPALRHDLSSRVTLSRDLATAIATEALTVAYQPLVAADTLGIVGFEALARLTHPELGSVPPETFISLAERSGLISALGEAVRSQVARDVSSVPALAACSWISVNASSLELRADGFAPTLLAQWRRAGLAPSHLVLEITESAALDDAPATRRTLRILRDAGVQLAFDDFGTGYSSLAQLKQLQPDLVKIDRSFVSALDTDSSARDIMESVVGLSHSLGVQVVAEGVESAEQLSAVRMAGCDLLQGFYLGRPRPAAELTETLATPAP